MKQKGKKTTQDTRQDIRHHIFKDVCKKCIVGVIEDFVVIIIFIDLKGLSLNFAI